MATDAPPRRGEAGFTLLELMVVVAIIAIIASILVPNFFHARAQAAVSACMSNIRSIATAAELYYSDHQAYPGSAGQTIVVDNTFGNPATPGEYLNQTPRDPAGGNGYTFTWQNNDGAQSYTIACTGNHDPSALTQLPNANSTATHITYDSSAGFGVK